jgi:hypothetical protein
MNIELLSTFQQNYPEEFDGTLDCASMAVCCAFNKVGKSSLMMNQSIEIYLQYQQVQC